MFLNWGYLHTKCWPEANKQLRRALYVGCLYNVEIRAKNLTTLDLKLLNLVHIFITFGFYFHHLGQYKTVRKAERKSGQTPIRATTSICQQISGILRT